jgi:hypothetical protein
MSLSGSGTVIQVNGANFTVADTTKELRANLIRFSTTSTGLSLSSLNGNVYTASNISAGYYHGNAKHLVSISDAAAGTYGGADAVVASVVVDSTGRITGISNVNITLDDVLKHGNATSNTVQFTNEGVSLKATGEINAGSFVGDGSGITDTTSATAGVYGSIDNIPIITIDNDRRVSSISTTPANRDTFSNVAARGSTTANVLTFSNAGNAILVTHASGKVGIANSAPGHALSVGTKFYVDKGTTSTNVAVVNGNVAATYYYGNAKYLTKTNDVSDGTYGSSTAIPAITITNGRVASIATNSIDVTLQGVSDTGNTTSNTLQFTNTGTSLITSGKVGIANAAPDHPLAVGANFHVKTDGGTVASYFSGDGANVTNIVGSSTVKGVTHGGSTSVPTIQIDSDGKITQIANTTIAQTLQAVTENGATSDQTITLTNATSLRAEGKVAVSTANAPTHDFHVGDNFYVDDDGANKVVVTGRISATDYVGDGGILSNISDLTSTTKGSASLVPEITFDAKGRISGITERAVQSNVNSATTNQLAFYTSATQVAGFSALTKDGDNMTLAGTFTADEVTVNGNLHVTGNTIVHDSVTIEDPILTIGNTNILSTQTVGTVFSRADANVAVAYEKSDDGQAINTLVFGYTTDTGVGADIIVDESRILESKFFGNVVATANITSSDTITAVSFVGSGSGLSDIQASNISDNFFNNFTSNVSRINSEVANVVVLDRDFTSNVSRIDSEVANVVTLNTRVNSEVANVVALEERVDSEVANVVVLDRDFTSNVLRIDSEVANVVVLDRDFTSNVTKIDGNFSNITTLQSNVNDIYHDGGSNTIVTGDFTVGGVGTFFIDQGNSKVGISNAAPGHELSVGTGFYVNASGSIVSTIGSTLNTGTVEVTGDSSTIDFKTGAGEDADSRIAQSSDGLVVSTGGDGSLAVAMTLYSNTDAKFESNLAIGGELNVSNLITSNIVFSSTASIQAAQISLEDVLAVSNSTTLDIITTGNVNTFNLLATGTKNFNIKHPIVEGKRLQHACIETARADNVYMGSAVLANGRVEIDLDITNKMTPGTFEALNKDIRVFTTNESDWDAVKGKVEGSKLRIDCQNGVSNAKVSWLVAGTRTDIEDLVVEV